MQAFSLFVLFLRCFFLLLSTESCQFFSRKRTEWLLLAPLIPSSRTLSRTNSQESLSDGGQVSPRTVRGVPKLYSDIIKLVSGDTESQDFLCIACGFTSKSEAEIFEDHVPHHRKRFKHPCSWCSFSSDDAQTVVDHLQQHTNHKNYNRFFPLMNGTFDSTKKIYRCPHCPYESVFQIDYTDHILYHRDKLSSRYHCSLCSFCSGDQRTVVEHEAWHYIDPKYFVSGIARVNRKYAMGSDQVPVYLEHDVIRPKLVTVKPKLTDVQLDDLRRKLSDIMDERDLVDTDSLLAE